MRSWNSISPTVRSAEARRLRMARRLGSAMIPKVDSTTGIYRKRYIPVKSWWEPQPIGSPGPACPTIPIRDAGDSTFQCCNHPPAGPATSRYCQRARMPKYNFGRWHRDMTQAVSSTRPESHLHSRLEWGRVVWYVMPIWSYTEVMAAARIYSAPRDHRDENGAQRHDKQARHHPREYTKQNADRADPHTWIARGKRQQREMLPVNAGLHRDQHRAQDSTAHPKCERVPHGPLQK